MTGAVAARSGALNVDHVVPVNDIVRMHGFDRLRPERQLEIVNDVPTNLRAIDAIANKSRGHRSWFEWSQAAIHYDAAGVARMRALETDLRAYLRTQNRGAASPLSVALRASGCSHSNGVRPAIDSRASLAGDRGGHRSEPAEDEGDDEVEVGRLVQKRVVLFVQPVLKRSPRRRLREARPRKPRRRLQAVRRSPPCGRVGTSSSAPRAIRRAARTRRRPRRLQGRLRRRLVRAQGQVGLLGDAGPAAGLTVVRPPRTMRACGFFGHSLPHFGEVEGSGRAAVQGRLGAGNRRPGWRWRRVGPDRCGISSLQTGG